MTGTPFKTRARITIERFIVDNADHSIAKLGARAHFPNAECRLWAATDNQCRNQIDAATGAPELAPRKEHSAPRPCTASASRKSTRKTAREYEKVR